MTSTLTDNHDDGAREIGRRRSPSSRSRRSPRRHGLGAVLAAVLLITAACGDDDSPGSSSQTSSTSAAPMQRLSVRVAVLSDSLGFMDGLAAQHMKFYEAEGLDVTYLPPVKNSPLSAQLPLNGDTDVVLTAGTSAISVIAANRPLKVFAAGATRGSTVTILSKAAVDRLGKAGTTPTSPVSERIRALKGLKIGSGSPNGATHTLFKAALRGENLDPEKDVSIQTYTTPNPVGLMIAAVKAGQSDGLNASPPEVIQAAADLGATVWLSQPAGDVPAWETGRGYFAVWAATSDYIAKNPEVVERVYRALDKAQKALKDDPAAARQALRKVGQGANVADDKIFNESFDMMRPAYQGVALERQKILDMVADYNSVADKPATLTFETIVHQVKG